MEMFHWSKLSIAKVTCRHCFLHPMAQQPLLGEGLLSIEALRSQTHHFSLGVISPSQRPQPDKAQRSTTTIHALGGIRTRRPTP